LRKVRDYSVCSPTPMSTVRVTLKRQFVRGYGDLYEGSTLTSSTKLNSIDRQISANVTDL
jgi:hypothetical protein